MRSTKEERDKWTLPIKGSSVHLAVERHLLILAADLDERDRHDAAVELNCVLDLRARLAAARALVIDPIGSRSVATLSKLRDILDLDRPFTPPAP